MKTLSFIETIAAWDLKYGRCRQLIEIMKVCEYSMSRSFVDLGSMPFINQNQNMLFSETTGEF